MADWQALSAGQQLAIVAFILCFGGACAWLVADWTDNE